MQSYDLCLAWNWEYDDDFVHIFEATCAAYGVSFLQVTSENLEQTLSELESGGITFASFLDRASDTNPRFLPLTTRVGKRNIFHINSHEHSLWARDKAVMHPEFIRRNLATPHTIILPSFEEQAVLPPMDLSRLGSSFVIKPAQEGGGDGVILEATTWEQVLDARQQFPHEKYLLQAHVTPKVLEGRPAWFRVLFCCGSIYACWWNPSTHVYTPIRAEESFCFGLQGLRQITRRIAQLCRLDLFSTEIAQAADGRFLVVDYVNEPVDLRLQSKALDGVPDAAVESIVRRLVRLAKP